MESVSYPVYAWFPKTQTVFEFTYNCVEEVPQEVVGKLCVNTGFSTNCTNTYGKWVDVSEDLKMFAIYKWCHIPFDQFPSEFKAHLLLLGVE
jgi:hypothetical protein